MIRLHILGALDLRSDDGAGGGTELRAVLSQPRRLALLAYLAVASPHGFHRRDRILSLFWPEQDAGRARASLNRAIYFLRHELGDGVLLSRGDEEVGLNGDRFWCDAAAFRHALEESEWQTAIDRYRGELLTGFHISGAAGFEDWLETERAHLRERASDTAWKLSEREEAAGRIAAAAGWARRGVDLAPFREVAFRRFLALLDRTGDRAGATHAYARFAEEMAAELDASPSPETQALIDAIRARATSGATAESLGIDTPVAQSAPMVAAPEPVAPRRSRWSRIASIAAAAAVVLGVTAVARIATRERPLDPLRVDIAAWENRTGDRGFDWLGTTAAERLLAGITLTGLVKDARLYQTSAALRAGTLVRGAIERAGSTVRAQAWITDVQRGGTVWAVPIMSAPVDSATELIEQIRLRVIGAVIALQNPRYASLFPVATPPPAWPAYQEFLEGEKLRSQGQIRDALQRFRWAAGIDPAFTWSLVHAGLVGLYRFRETPYPQVDSILAALRPRYDSLPLLQRYLVDHLAAVRAEDWDASYRAMKGAAELYPAEYGIAFANTAIGRNRPQEAVAVLRRPGLDSIHRANVRGYWFALTLSLHSLGEHRTELEVARRARHHAPQSAHAMYQQVVALAALGSLTAVRASMDTLLALPIEGGWFTAPLAMEMVAVELRAHGHTDAAAEQFARAIAWHHARPGAERATQERRERLAMLLYRAEKWADADTLFNALIREYATSLGYPDNTEYLGHLGMIAARRGNRGLARDIATKLKSKERAQALPGQEAVVYRAKIAALLGDRDEAMRLLTAAYGAMGTTVVHGDYDLEGMRDYPPFLEFVRPKG